MESTLFIELSASEEANLSGGGGDRIKVSIKQKAKGGRVKIDDSRFDDDATISADGVNTATVTFD
ncbi:MAG: hypothetical protein RM049_11305 [Nostoc sp. DedQUE04]|uniref:hypothetical protein n=1 Tax=Nostoc sp. DedQUE04 TaxID=3075390 RepID=UPI002AD37246|nr:hypothetical protein [Nostoc sp. DedQUE04]MDZ8135870.1 hypothetical protein [Nostoc sp. DedQUE04]